MTPSPARPRFARLPSFALPLFAALIAATAFFSGCATHPTCPALPVQTAILPTPIRLACIGDSITYGHLIANRDRDSYPAKLSSLLGPGWQVGNFGRSGATALRQSPRPYRDQPECADALKFLPHFVLLQLGTNDTKKEVWEAAGDHLVDDYIALIREFQSLPSHPQVIVCLPVPLFRDRGKPWDTDQLLRDQILPRIQSAAQRTQSPVLDLYALFADQSKLMPDGVHPNAPGAERMARAIHAALVGQPTPYPADITRISPHSLP